MIFCKYSFHVFAFFFLSFLSVYFSLLFCNYYEFVFQSVFKLDFEKSLCRILFKKKFRKVNPTIFILFTFDNVKYRVEREFLDIFLFRLYRRITRY